MYAVKYYFLRQNKDVVEILTREKVRKMSESVKNNYVNENA